MDDGVMTGKPGWYDDPHRTGGRRADRVARLSDRLGPKGPVHLTRYLATAALILGFLASGDRHHRALFGVLAVAFLVATVAVGIRSARQRARWRRLGEQP